MTPYQKKYNDLSYVSHAVTTVMVREGNITLRVFERDATGEFDKPFTGLLEAKDGGVVELSNQASIRDTIFRAESLFVTRLHEEDFV